MANPNKLFPLLVTDKLAQTREYYVEQLGCELVNDMPDYIQVRFGGGSEGPELAFMTTKAAAPMGRALQEFGGSGLIVSIPTESADDKHAALSKKKVTLASKPEDRPWGWRSFAAVDPNGLVLDFFHVLDQAARVNATG
ncbi:MAG: VOC family protein [Myxococcota bacterium]